MPTGYRWEIRQLGPQAPRGPALPVAGRPPATVPLGVAVLCERDREMLGHLARGRSTGQIAAAMSITTNTVRTRIRRVQRKLGVEGRDQGARRARALGLA